MRVLRHQLAIRRLGPLLVALHALLVEHTLALLPDLGDARHGLEGRGDEVAVVADGDVAAGCEGEGAVDDHFFAGGFAEGFGPFEFAGVTLHFELGGGLVIGEGGGGGGKTYVLVALAAAETEESGIVADEGDAFAGVARLRAEIARLDSSHNNPLVPVFSIALQNSGSISYLILAVVRSDVGWAKSKLLLAARLSLSKLSCQNLTLARVAIVR